MLLSQPGTSVEEGSSRIAQTVERLLTGTNESGKIVQLVETVLGGEQLTRFVRPLLVHLSSVVETRFTDRAVLRKVLETILALLSKKHRAGFEEEDCRAIFQPKKSSIICYRPGCS